MRTDPHELSPTGTVPKPEAPYVSPTSSPYTRFPTPCILLPSSHSDIVNQLSLGLEKTPGTRFWMHLASYPMHITSLPPHSEADFLKALTQGANGASSPPPRASIKIRGQNSLITLIAFVQSVSSTSASQCFLTRISRRSGSCKSTATSNVTSPCPWAWHSQNVLTTGRTKTQVYPTARADTRSCQPSPGTSRA